MKKEEKIVEIETDSIAPAKRKIVMVYQTVWQCLLSDLVTFSFALSPIALGILLNSAAMQWFGFLTSVLIIFSRASARLIAGEKFKMKFSEAILWLSSLEKSAPNAVKEQG